MNNDITSGRVLMALHQADKAKEVVIREMTKVINDTIDELREEGESDLRQVKTTLINNVTKFVQGVGTYNE